MPDSLMRGEHLIRPTHSSVIDTANDPTFALYTKWLHAVQFVRDAEEDSRGDVGGTPECKANEEALDKACGKRFSIEKRIAKLQHNSPLSLLVKLIVAELNIRELRGRDLSSLDEQLAVGALEDAKLIFGDLFKQLELPKRPVIHKYRVDRLEQIPEPQQTVDAPKTQEDRETIIAAFRREDMETEWSEMSFVGQTRLDKDAWWRPAKIGGENEYSARWVIGQNYGLQFINYLRHVRLINYDLDGLVEIVEAMTHVELGPIERAFFGALSDFIGGAETVVACGPGAKYFVATCNEMREEGAKK